MNVVKKLLSFACITMILSASSPALTLTSAFLNYPNPFKTRDSRSGTTEGTYFAYGLSNAANIEIRVYLIDGTLLWKRSYLSTEPQGTAGYHEVFWDGVPDTGTKSVSGLTRETVPNGILLSFLISNGKIIARNKITVFQ